MELYIDSRIDGAFKGWTGKSVYKFINGQIWVQKEYKYRYKYAYRPVAKIWKDGSTYFLEVDGMDDKIEVRRGTSSDLTEE